MLTQSADIGFDPYNQYAMDPNMLMTMQYMSMMGYDPMNPMNSIIMNPNMMNLNPNMMNLNPNLIPNMNLNPNLNTNLSMNPNKTNNGNNKSG